MTLPHAQQAPEPAKAQFDRFATGEPAVGPRPAAAAPPEVAKAPGDAPILAVDQIAATIQDGLLMVFGPDGDPVPPRAFADAAAAQPDAAVRLPDGTTAPAARVALVLEAQAMNRLGAAEDGDGWIMAMLQGRCWPEMAAEEDLLAEGAAGELTASSASSVAAGPPAERGTCELTALGHELMISTPSAGSFLIADAMTERAVDDPIGLFVEGGAAVSVAELVELLQAGDAGAADAGLALTGCSIEVGVDRVWLGWPGVADGCSGVRLAGWGAAPSGPIVSVFLADGRAATMTDLAAAFGTAAGDDVAWDDEQASGAPSARSDEDPGPGAAARLEAEDVGELPLPRGVPGSAAAPAPAGGVAAPSAPLPTPELALPQALTLTDDGTLDLGLLADAMVSDAPVVSALVAGLPDGALLSAGLDHGDGSWRVSARDLPGLRLLAPLDRADFVLDITLRSTAGTARQTIRVGHPPPSRPGATAAGGASALPEGLSEGEAEIAPESIVMVLVRGLPDGARLSAGAPDDGGWALSPLDLPGLTITPPPSGSAGDLGDGALTITRIAITERGGQVAMLAETVPLTGYAIAEPARSETMLEPASDPSAAPGHADGHVGGQAPAAGAIALAIDRQLLDGAGCDALVIRDLPAGASLSAGIYDPAIDGWVLLARDLTGLTIVPPADQPVDFTVTLMGVALRSGAPSRPRVLSRLPVARA